MRTISEISVHCSATRPGWMAQSTGPERIAEIRRWHVEQNGWADIGYHYLIDRDGKVYPGRPVERTGAFEPKVNARGIGVCLIGGFGANTTDTFDRHFTLEQDAALRRLIDKLRQAHPGITRVSGHNDYAPKACPGFRVDRWLSGKPARTFAESGTAIGSGSATVAATGLAAVEVLPLLSDTRSALEEARDTTGQADPLRWVLLVVIVAGAAYALWRRWQDWQAGRQ